MLLHFALLLLHLVSHSAAIIVKTILLMGIIFIALLPGFTADHPYTAPLTKPPIVSPGRFSSKVTFSAKSFSSMLVVEQVGTFGDGSSRTRDQLSRYHYGFIAPHEQSISDGMDKLIVIKRGRSQAAGLVKGPSAACLRASSTAWAKP